jgi:hypothetical protein
MSTELDKLVLLDESQFSVKPILDDRLTYGSEAGVEIIELVDVSVVERVYPQVWTLVGGSSEKDKSRFRTFIKSSSYLITVFDATSCNSAIKRLSDWHHDH